MKYFPPYFTPGPLLSAILGFTFDSAQCNRKSAICGLKIPSGQRSRSPSLIKRIAASGNEIAALFVSGEVFDGSVCETATNMGRVWQEILFPRFAKCLGHH